MNKLDDIQRIATEEAWAPQELLQMYRKLLQTKSYDNPGFRSLWGYYTWDTERSRAMVARVTDMGENRLREMDENGISRQVLLLTMPGVQVFDEQTAVELAVSCNDQLAEHVRSHPDRYVGLSVLAPQNPRAAAKELERGINELGMKGAVINSHTHGEYLDDPKFWDIFAAAEALDVPIYLHPSPPSNSLIQPLLPRGLDGPIFGYAVEAGMHLLRIVVAGVFDRFPNLKLVVGHLGEGIPYWLFRIDFMHGRMVRDQRYEGAQPLKRKPSEYLRENVYYTTSGMAWEPAIMFVHQVMGANRLMYAMDYPYQFVPEEVKVTDNLPLSHEHLKMFYQTNAETVFALADSIEISR